MNPCLRGERRISNTFIDLCAGYPRGCGDFLLISRHMARVSGSASFGEDGIHGVLVQWSRAVRAQPYFPVSLVSRRSVDLASDGAGDGPSVVVEGFAALFAVWGELVLFVRVELLQILPVLADCLQ